MPKVGHGQKCAACLLLNINQNTYFVRGSLLAMQVMLHQPSGGANGMAADIAIIAEEIIKTRARLNEIYAEHTGRVSACLLRLFSFHRRPTTFFMQFCIKSRSSDV